MDWAHWTWFKSFWRGIVKHIVALRLSVYSGTTQPHWHTLHSWLMNSVDANHGQLGSQRASEPRNLCPFPKKKRSTLNNSFSFLLETQNCWMIRSMSLKEASYENSIFTFFMVCLLACPRRENSIFKFKIRTTSYEYLKRQVCWSNDVVRQIDAKWNWCARS